MKNKSNQTMRAVAIDEFGGIEKMKPREVPVLPRATFLMQIWGCVPETRTRTVDMHIDQLRKKLGPYADQYIETVVGIGYRFWPFPGYRYR